MEQKINIAELLKDCSTGMELDSTIMENVYFDEVLNNSIKCYYIKNHTKIRSTVYFNKFGEYFGIENGKCVIFPKGKTTWEGFHRPFKDGDVFSAIISGKLWYGIYKKEFDRVLYCYVSYSTVTKSIYQQSNVCAINSISEMHFATEEEKEKLFKAIKDNGYRWNPESKTLEKLVEPIFKAGDRVMKKCGASVPVLITRVGKDFYYSHKESFTGVFSIAEQDDWELVPDKFDITTLVPFESRVLVRAANRKWVTAFYSHYDKESSLHYCVVGGLWYEQCIPYEGNEHLLNTTDDCNEFYKNW